MKAEAQAVLERALGLDPVERAELIEALFRSFDTSGDRRTDARWAAEAESRIEAFEAGKLSADSAEVALRRINKK